MTTHQSMSNKNQSQEEKSELTDQQISEITRDTEPWLSRDYPISDDILAQCVLAKDDVQLYCDMAMAYEGQNVYPHGMHVLIHEVIKAAKQNHQHAVLVLPPEHGKALRDDEMIPTPQGWRRMDSLSVGDMVFGGDGKPTKITAIYPNQLLDMRRIHFSDKTSIDACVDHQWLSMTRYTRRGRVFTTRQIEETLLTSGRPNHSIPVCKPIQIPDADLPIDPWILGYWLGNGTRGHGSITAHGEDADWVRSQCEKGGMKCSEGFMCKRFSNARHMYIHGIRPALRKLGVLHVKRIPESYLWSSESQRRRLLSGLLDSDGCASARKGIADICQTDKDLFEDIEQLMRSLGIKVQRTQSAAQYNGKITGTSYRLAWAMHEQMFTNPRKAKMWKPVKPQADRVKWRTIVSIETIEPTSGRCIVVDNADHLYLAGKNFIVTHNSSQIAKVLVWQLAHNTKMRIGLTSANERTLLRNHTWLRKTLISPLTEKLWPDLTPDAKASTAGGGGWSQTKLYIAGQRDPAVISATLAADVRGLRFDCIWMDDVVTRLCRFSEAARIEAHSCIHETWLKCLTGDGLAIITNNTWHREDSIHRATKSKAFLTLWLGYVNTDHIYYRIHNPPSSWKFKTSGVLPLWKDVWPKKRLEMTFAADPPSYKRLYMQQAVIADDSRLPTPDTWGTYATIPLQNTGARPFGFLDTSGGKNVEKGDYASLMIGLISRERLLYLIDCWVKRAHPEEQIMALWRAHRMMRDAGYGGLHHSWIEVLPKDELWIQMAIDTVRKKMSIEHPDLPWPKISFDYPDTTASKESRIERLHGPLGNGGILFPAKFREWALADDSRGKSWNLLIAQCEDFGSKATDHDDAPDSLEGLYRLAHSVGPGLAHPDSGIVGPREQAAMLREIRRKLSSCQRRDPATGKTVRERRGRGFLG